MKHFITARIFEMEEPLKFSTVDICDRESDKKDTHGKNIIQGEEHKPNEEGTFKWNWILLSFFFSSVVCIFDT